MSVLLIVVVLLFAVVVVGRLTWSLWWGERRSLDRHERAMDVLGSLRGRQPRPTGDIDSRGSDQPSSLASHPGRPDEAAVRGWVEVIDVDVIEGEQDPRRLDASGAEVGASGGMTSSDPTPSSEDRDRSKIWEAVIGNEGTGSAGRRRGPRRIASGLLGSFSSSRRTRPRPRGWPPLLEGTLAVLALFAIAVTLIAGLMASSGKKPAASSSPTTAPSKVSPTTAPVATAPPSTATWPVSATQDVWLKTGPGRSYGNIVVLPAGAAGKVACYVPNGQVETNTVGTASTTWWRTYDGQNVGWVSADYLNTQGAHSAPMC